MVVGMVVGTVVGTVVGMVVGTVVGMVVGMVVGSLVELHNYNRYKKQKFLHLPVNLMLVIELKLFHYFQN